MHQGLALSSLLYVIVMEAVFRQLEMPYYGSCCMWTVCLCALQTFAGQTFPGQVILRNFHVGLHNVCKCRLYRPSHMICRYTERLLNVCLECMFCFS